MILEILELRPSPGERHCDFCYAADIRWRYPCRSFIGPSDAYGNTVVTEHSVGDWAACESCHLLIEAGQREELAARSYESSHAPAEYQQLKQLARRQDLIAWFRALHDGFFDHRTAPAVPICRSEAM